MSWRDLVGVRESVTVPWTGGDLRHGVRRWKLANPPAEFGWYVFDVEGPRAVVSSPAEATARGSLRTYTGHLAGSVLFLDDYAQAGGRQWCVACHGFGCADTSHHALPAVPVVLVPAGLSRFSHVRAARFVDDGPIVFVEELFPVGPESEVQEAYEDTSGLTYSELRWVPFSLRGAYDEEVAFRAETERRRAAAEQARLAHEAYLAGATSAGRRALAQTDLRAALQASLRVADAQLLDFTEGPNGATVRFRAYNRRFECVVHPRTLQVLDAGVCLNHHDEELTLESLPGVLGEAIRRDVLHVFRHV